jgi:integrase
MTEPMRGQRRKTLTDRKVADLRRRAKRYVLSDPEQRGMYIRVMPSGPHVYAAVARDPYGRQVWATIGSADVLGIEDARDKARKAIGRIKEGKRAIEPPPVAPKSYQAVAKEWLELYVVKQKKLRSRPEIERLLKKFVFPVWGKRDFVSVRRRDANDLLDNIAKNSEWNADHVLSIIRKIANWYATRDEDYESPFVKGMRRTNPEARERSRTLTDDELRRVWHAAEEAGTFGALIKVLLLTAQRRGAVVGMKWSDLTSDGVWKIPTEARAKGNAGALKLPETALAVIKAQPRFSKNKYVLAAARGDGPLNGFNKRKAAFDEACGVIGWTLHDCRRTARSLLSRAGVPSEHAEQTLGHKLQGVEGTYNQYDFFREKSDALASLAALIERIVNPPSGGNVVMLHQADVS